MAGTRDILNAIADEKALALFDAIAVSDDSDSEILITKVRLSRKEYYMRISRLVKAGLASRQSRDVFSYHARSDSLSSSISY